MTRTTGSTSLARHSVLLALLLGCCVVGAAHAQSNETLYRRVGGYDVIAAIAADFTRGLGTDPVLRPYFFARADDSRRRILQMFRELLCADTGGPCLYVGRDMKTAHVGLPIGETEWTALMSLWGRILDQHKIIGTEKTDMVQVFAKYRDTIVSVAR